jgi:hypothetical protein
MHSRGGYRNRVDLFQADMVATLKVGEHYTIAGLAWGVEAMRIGCRSMSPPRVVHSVIHDLGNRDVRADNVGRGYLPISPFRLQDHAAASDFGTREECTSSAFPN